MKHVLLQRLLCLLNHFLLLAEMIKEFRQKIREVSTQKPTSTPCLQPRGHIRKMEGISSTPVENFVQFLKLRDRYKSDLLEDSRLTKAAGLAAQQELLLESPAPDTWKEPCLKSVNRQLRQWTKKIRQPGGTHAIGRDDDSEEDDDEHNLAVGPFQQFMGNIAKIQKGIKRKAVAATPQTPITPTLKQSLRLRKAEKYPSFPLNWVERNAFVTQDT